MKIVIFLMLSSAVFCDTLLIIDAKRDELQKRFLKAENGCYYQNSYKNRNNCYKQTGNIIIKSTEILSESFLKKYHLKYLKTINKQNHTALYKALNSSLDIIEVVNKINRENESVIARVEWIKPRKLF